jgi:hypothetical protein
MTHRTRSTNEARRNGAQMTTQLRRSIAATGAVALAAASMVFAVSPASAAPTVAYVRAAHFSPTTPGVDVYLTPLSGGATSRAWLTGVAYGAVSPYETLTPGAYTVSMRLAGAAATSPAALSWELDAKAGAAYTIAGVGSDAAVHGVVIPDDLSSPPSGQGSVRVIQAASRAPVVSVAATSGPVIASAAQFSTVSSYANVPAGTFSIKAASASDPALSATSSLSLRSGEISSILVLDAAGSGIAVHVLQDSASSGVVPGGSIDAGGGGTAGPSSGLATLIAIGAAGVLGSILLVWVSLAWRRRPARTGGGRHATV